MKKGKTILVAVAVITICLVAAQLGMSVPDKNKIYEFEITTPEYTTDAARAIDAYERLMERYMYMTEDLLLQVGDDCRRVAIKLDSLDARLTEISNRLARIEKALGIDPNGNSATPVTDAPGVKIKGKR